MTLAESVATDDRTVALKALRDRLAADLDECQAARDVGTLAQRLMDVLAQLDEIAGAGQHKPKETGLSDFEKRLRERQSSTAAARRSKSS